MEQPFALHLTWTTYGTWLPGDPRGYVAHTLHAPGDWEGRQNSPGTEYAVEHPRTHALARAAQKDTTVWLTSDQATVVAHCLIEVVLARGWCIRRGAIMSNHLHLVVLDCPNDGPAVRRVLKGTTQAALSRHHGSPRRWWTAGGSDRYKNDDQAIENAIRYVEKQERILIAIADNALMPGEEP